MSSATDVFALTSVRHNHKDYKPGDKIPGLKQEDLERLKKLGVVRVEQAAETPPLDPPPPPNEPGGEDDPPKDPPADPPGESDPPQDPPADPPKEPDKKGKEKQ